MKSKLLLCVIFLTVALLGNATVWTVSNNPNSPGQYDNIQDAMDAASAGDTIYISGSQTSYGDITITKQLTLIGAGYNTNNQFNFKTQLNAITLEIGMDGFGNPTSNPSGSVIIGLQADNIVGGTDIDNIQIFRNHCGGIWLNSTGSGWVIKNNITDKIDGGTNATNVLIYNNIIKDQGGIRYFSKNSITVSNNLFIYPYHSASAFWSVSYAILSNNIFYGISIQGCDYCTFNNNISIGGDYTDFIYDHNTGANNYVDVNPQFVSVAATEFSFSDDYHLQASSPGKNAGTDGTDIGIYGGSYPFPSGGDVPWQTSAMPSIPQIIEMNIQNAVIPVDSTLHVQVKARIQQ